MLAALLSALAISLAIAGSAGAVEPVPVQVPAAGLSTSPTDLRAHWFAPQGATRHAAVVMVHGCGGAYAKDGRLNARHRMWGDLLAANGYGALMLDSFSSSGIKELCTQSLADRSLKESDRVGDAYAALGWLRLHMGVDSARVALLGWSHGGGVTLEAIRRTPPGIAQGFAAAVSFYPGCTTRAKKAESFAPYAPLLVLIGEADDWTPAAPCVALTTAARAHGVPVHIVTYPGAYHDFDNPSLSQVRLRTDVPNGTHPGKGVHTGPNPAAREDAKERVLAFFAEQFPR